MKHRKLTDEQLDLYRRFQGAGQYEESNRDHDTPPRWLELIFLGLAVAIVGGLVWSDLDPDPGPDDHYTPPRWLVMCAIAVELLICAAAGYGLYWFIMVAWRWSA